MSRLQAGIPTSGIRMAVLLQELVAPELSFIMHTVNPLTGNPDEALVELAVGLGEILASSALPGTPVPAGVPAQGRRYTLSACANFSVALRPSRDNGTDGLIRGAAGLFQGSSFRRPDGRAASRPTAGANIATFSKKELGRPQDVEGVYSGDEIYVVQTRPQQGL